MMKYKIDYFGYVYEWRNKNNDMKYIGSHYGSVNDSYKGSSKWFLSSYNINPKNFIMSVLEYVTIDDTNLLLMCEQKWLDMITDIKSNVKYYNLKNEAEGGWSHITLNHIEQRAKTLKEKHALYGLSIAEISSYNIKKQTRHLRWINDGFSLKEQEQHNKYSVKIKIITPINEIFIYNSLNKANQHLPFDANYGAKITNIKGNYRGYKIFRISEPLIVCKRKNNESV